MSSKYCDACQRKVIPIQTKVRTMCYECRELYCQGCSDTHLTFKWLMNHTLIDLDPPQSSIKTDENRKENVASSSDNEANTELASDFLEQVVVTEKTVLYRAQVAVENDKKKTATQDVERKPRNVSDIRATKLCDFRAKVKDDLTEPYINAVLILGDTFIIVDNHNRKLKCFTESGQYLSSADLTDSTWGITKIACDQFATCDYKKIILWNFSGHTIQADDKKYLYTVEYDAQALHFNSTFYCVLHRKENAVTILDDRGRQIRKFVIKEAFGKKVEFGFDIHSDRHTHHMYIPCVRDNKGILCVSIDGKVNDFHATHWTPWGISYMYGFFCVVNYSGNCVMIPTKEWKSMSKLLDTSDAKSCAYYISVNEAIDKVIVSYYGSDLISVFSIQ